jgi:amidophosphoribosyltransferase
VVDHRGIRSTTFCEPVTGALGQCIFEHVYFARPDSMVFSESVHDTRIKLGRRLAQEHPVEADIVVAVPDSGASAALGYSQTSKIPLDYGFIRNHYVGRTFIMPSSDLRSSGVDMKLAVVPNVVRGRRVIVVDDSLIRGTTSRRRINALRDAGATEIHLRISCPPTRHPCYFGIDFPDRKELIATDHSVEEVRKFIGADSLAYLSHEGLLASVEHPRDYCTGCFTGKYPIETVEEHKKEALENTAYIA